MTPPPLPPDDQPPPLPTGPDPQSSSPEGSGRDPLFDDPHFAELLARDTDRSAEPGRQPEPAFAEELEGPPESEPIVAEVVSQSPAGTSDLPKAYPVRPAVPPEPVSPPLPLRAEPVRPAVPSGPSTFPTRRPDSGPPPPASRPRIYGACCVIGCVGIAVLASIGFLAFVAIVVLDRLGDQIDDRDSRRAENALAASRPGPIVPPEAIPKDKIFLKGRFDAVGRAGGGRFLLLKIPATRQLAIFDPNQADVDYLDIGESDVFFAGGAAKIYVYKSNARTIERWDILTRTLEYSAKQPASLPAVTNMAVGAASDGLIYLFSIGEGGSILTIVDPVELKPRRTHRIPELRTGTRAFVRASDNGNVLTVCTEQGASVFKYEGTQLRPLNLWRDGVRPQLATPSPDGEVIYTPRGVYSTAGDIAPLKAMGYFYTLPTAHGSGLYLSLDVAKDGKVEGSPRLHAAGSPEPLATLDQLTFGGGQGSMYVTEWTEVPHDQRVHVWPAAGLIAFLPVINGSMIELVQVDVGQTLKKSGEEHLVIGSDPPTAARVGEQWSYRPLIWTLRRKEIDIRLRERPSEMQLRGGVITWTPSVPGPFDVVIEVSDPVMDRTTEQRFRVVVADEEED